MSLEKCCDSPDISEFRLGNRNSNSFPRRMRCYNCQKVVEAFGDYYDIAMAWNESCVKELPCMEIVSM
jgi:hypothetical protein